MMNTRARTKVKAPRRAEAGFTPAAFRWEDEGGVYALFPTLPGTCDPATCTCYQHVGQHSSADLLGCVQRSRPATEAEFGALWDELERIGYRLRLCRQPGRAAYYRQRWDAIHAPKAGGAA